MKKRKGKKGWMAIKIDLEKTHDRLNWDFVIDTLKELGLPSCFDFEGERCEWNVVCSFIWAGKCIEPTSKGDTLFCTLKVVGQYY